MLDYGFSKAEAHPLLLKDMIVKSIAVKSGTARTIELVAAEDFFITDNSKEGLAKYDLSYKLPSSVPAPLTTGTKLGKLTISYDGAILKEMDLLAGADVDYREPPKPTFIENLQKVFSNLLNFKEIL